MSEETTGSAETGTAGKTRSAGNGGNAAKPQDGGEPGEARLLRQIEFILEIDKAKQVLRRSHILDGSRRENDAEHSWHLALMALVLAEHANEPVDVCRVVKMLLIHDVVEIDAGDTFVYDADGQAGRQARERAAAERIFGLLPPDQGEELRQLWEEFERRQSPDARFAAALDRLQPLLANYHTQGSTWRAHDVARDAVIAFNRHMQEGSQRLWAYASGLIEEAVARGYLKG